MPIVLMDEDGMSIVVMDEDRMRLTSFQGPRNECQTVRYYDLQFWFAPGRIGNAEMEFQAVAGLQQGLCEYRSLCSAPRVSSCVLAQPRLRNSGLLGRSFVAGEPQRAGRAAVVVSCGSGDASGEAEAKEVVVLKIGSPVVVTQAPPLLKTAEPMPMMRPNNGLINVGDAGRIMDRRPKDTWAVRFAVGAYLIDRKYFEPLKL